VQYQTPWERLILKLEYDGNDYQHEPQANNQPQRTPSSARLSYCARWISAPVSAQYLAWPRCTPSWTDLPPINDPPLIFVSPSRPQQAPDWVATSQDIELRAGWHVDRIEERGRELRVTLADAGGIYWRDRLDRVAAVLHRDAPAWIDRFVLVYRQDGIEDVEHVIDRDAWSTPFNQPLPPRERREAVIARPVRGLSPARPLYEQRLPRFESGFSFGYQQTLGGPDAFILYQVYAEERAKLRIRDDTWVQGSLHLGVIDNYNKFKFTPQNEALPRVRTFLREVILPPRD
jgi:hypothetical protein